MLLGRFPKGTIESSNSENETTEVKDRHLTDINDRKRKRNAGFRSRSAAAEEYADLGALRPHHVFLSAVPLGLFWSG